MWQIIAKGIIKKIHSRDFKGKKLKGYKNRMSWMDEGLSMASLIVKKTNIQWGKISDQKQVPVHQLISLTV